VWVALVDMMMSDEAVVTALVTPTALVDVVVAVGMLAVL
jgi:hypothetical protein